MDDASKLHVARKWPLSLPAGPSPADLMAFMAGRGYLPHCPRFIVRKESNFHLFPASGQMNETDTSKSSLNEAFICQSL
jgi:hypothetical protein